MINPTEIKKNIQSFIYFQNERTTLRIRMSRGQGPTTWQEANRSLIGQLPSVNRNKNALRRTLRTCYSTPR